jgi:dTDP-4-dehydrorhamnose reductase
MKKLWILGAQGLLGRALVKECSARGIKAVGAGRQEADITSLEMLQKEANQVAPSHIINCAAYTDVDGAEKDYERAWSINAKGAEQATLVALSTKAHLIHISTDFVFDGTKNQALLEEEEASPVNAYGRSKWEGEQLVRKAYPGACILRTSWLFGSGGKNFFSSLLSAFKAKEQMRIIADQWGRVTYAPDLANAVLDLLDYKGTLHFANEGVVSRYEVACALLEKLRQSGAALQCKEIHPVSKEAFPLPAPRPSYSILSTEKYTHSLGRAPRAWREVLSAFLEDMAL